MPRTSATSQSSAINASLQRGAPVTSASHAPSVKRSPIGIAPIPAKACDNSLWSACRQFIHRIPFFLMAALVALLPCTQTSTIAGSSLNAQTAEHGAPDATAGPVVVITDRAVASFETSFRNAVEGTKCVDRSSPRSCGAVGSMAAFPLQAVPEPFDGAPPLSPCAGGGRG